MKIFTDFKVVKVRSNVHLLHKGIPKGSKSTRRLDKHLRKIRKSLNHVVLNFIYPEKATKF